MPSIRGIAPRWGAGSAALAAGLLSALIAVAPAVANHAGPPSGAGVRPTLHQGNPTCSDLDPDTIEFRIENPRDGTYSDGTLTVTIDVRDTAVGPVFDFTANIGVDSVFVKGGPNGNLYGYDEHRADTGLHAPVNHNNDRYYGLSHVSFCYDVKASVKVDKRGDTLSKVGDDVKYTFTITNDGDVALTLDSVTDTLLGDLEAHALSAGCGTLAVGASCDFNVIRTVQAGDSDPLPNTVTVKYGGKLPGGATTTVTDSDDHSVELFQPSVTITKTGDTLSKIGDKVRYEITLHNTSSADSPNLTCVVADDKVGFTTTVNLAPGGVYTKVIDDFVIPSDAADPFVNKVTAICKVDGFPNILKTSDTHSVNLFQPSVKIDKTGDTLSKIGDKVHYEIKVTNTSSPDSPSLSCVITDATIGFTKTVSLVPGASDVSTAEFVIPASASDPFVNTATVDCAVHGFPNTVSHYDTHSTNLFQPSVKVDKTGPPMATEGDTITYTYTITNTGSADSPNLILESVVDDVLGALTASATLAGCGSLAPAETCTFTANYPIPIGTSSPLVNVVWVDYHPYGFPNEIKDDDDHSVIVKPKRPPQGCTPGYWKNHPESWVGYSPNQTLEAVFDLPDVLGMDNNTLSQALAFQGGPNTEGAARILLRAAVAALLNAAHPEVNYPRTTAEVIGAVNAALLTGDREAMLALAAQLDADNNLGCPL